MLAIALFGFLFVGFHEDMATDRHWRSEESDICLYVENYSSYAC